MIQRIQALYQEGGVQAVAVGIYRFGYHHLLPDSGKKTLKDVYVDTMRRFSRNFETFEYEGNSYQVYYTSSTIYEVRDLVTDGKITQEHIPLSTIDATEPVDAVIDVGAYIGLYSVLLKLLNPDADLYAFEPADGNRAILTEAINENRISGIISDEVVSGKTGKMTFYIDSDSQSVSHSTKATDDFTTVKKSSLALSDLFKREEINKAFIKIDAEGEESAIIDDLMTTDLKYLEGIVEVHPDKINLPASEIVDRLETACDQCDFLAETTPQYEYNRPVYHFIRAG